MSDKTHLLPPPSDRPFALTDEKYSTESACGEVKGSNFPYHEVQSLPGYSERNTSSLSAYDVTNEAARCLEDFAKQQGGSLGYRQRDISFYLWMQASRSMLPWKDILREGRLARKKDPCRPVAHYFGYCHILGKDDSKRNKALLKLARYIIQEGVCAGCNTEFPYNRLTVDRIIRGREQGIYKWSNVQLLCRPCHNLKDNCEQKVKRP